MVFLYEIFIGTYRTAAGIYSLFNDKARLWVKGRENWQQMADAIAASPKKKIWFHCASLGEFEQGRPVIEAFRKKLPDHEIVLTFFSPSGYEVRKNYAGADYILYLPSDSKRNAKKFIQAVNPSMAVFVKYEFWFNYINELHKAGIPLYMISVNFRQSQHYFKWYGKWFANQLKKIKHFFVQNQKSLDLLQSIGIQNVTVSGDTRFDRVYAIASNAEPVEEIEIFKAEDKIFLAGSSWPPGEKMIRQLYDKNISGLKFIIAPHDVNKTHIKQLQELFPEAVLYSDFKNTTIINPRILIIDGIGMLSKLYRYAHISYIGGGFGVGIHNILEAATFGSPVIFGPNYKKFQEAVDLVEEEGAFAVNDEKEFLSIAEKLLSDHVLRNKASKICKQYVEQKKGATERIVEGLKD